VGGAEGAKASGGGVAAGVAGTGVADGAGVALVDVGAGVAAGLVAGVVGAGVTAGSEGPLGAPKKSPAITGPALSTPERKKTANDFMKLEGGMAAKYPSPLAGTGDASSKDGAQKCLFMASRSRGFRAEDEMGQVGD
jgi:hypothetical protein